VVAQVVEILHSAVGHPERHLRLKLLRDHRHPQVEPQRQRVEPSKVESAPSGVGTSIDARYANEHTPVIYCVSHASRPVKKSDE
jgi:hypothetical protein